MTGTPFLYEVSLKYLHLIKQSTTKVQQKSGLYRADRRNDFYFLAAQAQPMQVTAALQAPQETIAMHPMISPASDV
jgi:hypothetical protein